MSNGSGLEQLFRCARDYEFEMFDALFLELERDLPPEEFGEAYLMRAQIKLYTADKSVVTDLETAAKLGAKPQQPCLAHFWRADAPNRFNVFCEQPGVLQGFVQELGRISELFEGWYGEAGGGMVDQFHSEILYFCGEFDKAIGLAETRRNVQRQNYTDAINAQGLLYRCHLAQGHTREAEQSMLEVIRLSKTHAECMEPYQSLRMWANLTTGWSGDTPRYYHDPDGSARPVFEDRLAAIQTGYGITSELEAPFVRYAKKHYGATCTMRQFYMDIFHMIYWFQAEEYEQTEKFFVWVYQIARETGLVIPFAEYGRQMTPLLQHVKHSDIDCSAEWLDRVILLTDAYEEGLIAYRALDV